MNDYEHFVECYKASWGTVVMKEFHGNYVVLKTLIHLRGSANYPNGSFIWNPPMDFSSWKGEHVINSDIDIVVILDGKLIIGECKTQVADFTVKVINNLIWLGNILFPDKIIVACNNGSLEEKVRLIKNGLKHQQCQVISYTASQPWYNFPRLFGLEK